MNFRGRWDDVAHTHAERFKGWAIDAWSRAHRGWWRMRRSSAWLSEQWAFYHAWRQNPRGIGAVLPSGRALAAAITRDIGPDSGPVLELGAGTGVFTRALLGRGVWPSRLALVERDPHLVARLRREFPGATVLDIDATQLHRYRLFAGERAGAAVCGLPLLNMPLRVRLRIVRATFAQLRPDGACYLFTYGVRCSVPVRMLERMGLRARRVATVYPNMPPARVWKLTRRPAVLPTAGREQGLV